MCDVPNVMAQTLPRHYGKHASSLFLEQVLPMLLAQGLCTAIPSTQDANTLASTLALNTQSLLTDAVPHKPLFHISAQH